MTYGQLLQSVHGWTARHIAQDLMLMNGFKAMASEFDIKKVREAEAKESQ